MSDNPTPPPDDAWWESATEINQNVPPQQEKVDIVLEVQNVSVTIDSLIGGKTNGKVSS